MHIPGKTENRQPSDGATAKQAYVPAAQLAAQQKTTDERWVLRFLRFQIHKFAATGASF